MSDQYSVWGTCEHPLWLRENDGEPDMQIIAPTDLDTARKHAANLALMCPGSAFEVRDAAGDVAGREIVADVRTDLERAEVRVTGPKPTSVKPRRSLGGRGR